MAYIFFTSPTSGTASLGRIVEAVAKGRKIKRLTARATNNREEEGFFLDPAPKDVIYWFQGPRHWNPDIDLSLYSVIANFRDPRDLACNQYWWALQHPNDRDPPEIADQKRRDVEAKGIDLYVSKKNLSGLFNIYLDIAKRSDAIHTTYTSYAQLCCAFDYLIDSLCRVFDRAPSETLEALRVERPENLGRNDKWVEVGGTWRGSDVSPGRFRGELRPDTVALLKVKFAAELNFCKTKDAPFLALHYG